METLGPWLKAAIAALAATLTFLPLTQTDLPPLVDLPNHLAQMHLAMVLPQDPHLSAYYEYRWHFVPNLALDLVFPYLTKVCGIYEAGRLFLAWTFLQIFLGVCLLRYAVRKAVGLWPIASFLFFYNASLSWGFVNFLFASGLVLIFFAVWIMMAPRGGVIRATLFSAILAVTFFLHLIAAAILCLCIATYQLERLWSVLRSKLVAREKRLACSVEITAAAVPIAVTLALWVYSAAGTGEQPFEYRGLQNVLGTVFSPFLMTGSDWDILLGFAVLGFVIVGIVSKQISVAEPLVLPCVGLLIVALVTPAMVLGVFGTHFRIPFLLGCIFVAGIEIKRTHPGFSAFAIALIGALFTFRMVEISVEWRQFDTRQRQFRDVIAQIKPGSKVLTALDRLRIDAWKGAMRPEVFLHMTALTVIEASAYDPLLFTDRRQQNVTVRPPFARIDTLQGKPPLTGALNQVVLSGPRAHRTTGNIGRERDPAGYWANWTKDFDYLVRFSFVMPRTKLKGPLKLLDTGDWFDLYKIEKPRP